MTQKQIDNFEAFVERTKNQLVELDAKFKGQDRIDLASAAKVSTGTLDSYLSGDCPKVDIIVRIFNSAFRLLANKK